MTVLQPSRWQKWAGFAGLAIAASVSFAACDSDDDETRTRPEDATRIEPTTTAETPTETTTVEEAPTEAPSVGSQAYVSSLESVVQEVGTNFPDCRSVLESYRVGWEGIDSFGHCPRAFLGLIARFQQVDPPQECQLLHKELILRAAALASRDDASISDVFLQSGRSNAWTAAASQCGFNSS
jgi:hypothetical protein